MLRTILFALAACLGLATTAHAQAVSTATPNTPGKGTQLQFDVDATLPPVAGRIPKGLTFTAPAGYKVDFRAVNKRCKQIQATLDECPDKSRIGTGSLIVQVTQPTQVRDVNVPLSFYLKSKKDVFAVAFLAGTRVIPGMIQTSNGMVLNFNPLPDPPAFPQVSYLLKRVTVSVGASRKVVKKTRRGRKSRVRNFIRNPATCPGSWASTVTFTYPDATFDVLPAPTACIAP
jgi:hypothetical protein